MTVGMTEKEIRDRDDAMVRDHESGMTYRQIGEKYGLSPSYAGPRIRRRKSVQVRKAMRGPQPPPEPTIFEQFSVRTANCLRAEGLDTEEKLRAFVADGGIALRKIPNMGNRSAAEVLARLGLTQQRERHPPSEARVKGAISLLKRAGYEVKKV